MRVDLRAAVLLAPIHERPLLPLPHPALREHHKPSQNVSAGCRASQMMSTAVTMSTLSSAIKPAVWQPETRQIASLAAATNELGLRASPAHRLVSEARVGHRLYPEASSGKPR